MAGDLVISTINGVAIGTKNVIIDGNFNVNQRGVSGTVTLAAGAYGHDRWKGGASGATYTFATVANVTTLTISAGSLIQVVEGLNLQSGTYTLSFSGTAQGKINGGSYSASGVTGTATGGTNLNVEFNTGTLSLVQLEKGSTATSFDYRPYGTELALCQRYYWQISENDGNSTFWIGAVNSALSGRMVFPFNMRSTPTVTFDAALYINDASANALVNAATARTAVSGGGVSVLFSSASSVLTLGRAASLYGTGSTTPSFVGLSSEL